MDADSSYGGSDTAQDLHSNHDNNSFNDTATTTHTQHHDSPSTTITLTTEPTAAESNNFYHKNEITLPVNYDENDYQKQQQQPQQPNYLTTANLSINESTDNPSSNLEEMSKNFKSTSRLNIMEDNNQSNGGLDNPAFMKTEDDDDDDDDYNNKLEIKSTFDNNRPYNGDLNTTAALGLSSPNNNNNNHNNNNNKKNHDEQQQLAEAVNLELINLKPTNGKDVTGMYENGMSTIPIKKENDNEIGNPYDEYFVPVNEHRKYMRGEKLYVTMDKRNKKTRNKCLCWGVCLCIVAAAVIIGILAAVGVIGNQGAHPVQEVSARHFSNDVSETPAVKIGGGIFGLPPDLDNDDVTTVKQTPGPPVSTVSSSLPMTETSMIQVPHALESQLIIDNLQFTPQLNDTNSAEFKQLAQKLETELKHSLFDNNILNHGSANIEVKVLDFAPGSVVVHYRIVWTFKDGIHNPPDPINADMAKRRLRSLLAKNDGLIGGYSVSEKSVISGPVLDSCRIDNYGCEFNCAFDYHLADFICTCPAHKILASDGKTCINYDENNLPDFPFEPQPTNPPEEMFDVQHHDYHETIVQPTSEPTSEPEPKHEDNYHYSQPEPTSEPEPKHEDNDHYAHPEPEPTTEHPQPEPEVTNPPEETYDVHHNYHETMVQPTSEPASEPSPEPKHEDTDNFAQPEPVPTSQPEPHPEPTVKEEIEPEMSTQSNSVSHENYIHIQEITSPSPEPLTEPYTQPNSEPAAEPTSEPAPEPTSKSVPEIVVSEASTEAISENVSKSIEFNVIPIINAVTEPTAEPTAEPAAEPTAEPAPEPTVQPIPEPSAEPAAEPTPEPAAEPTPEPTFEHISEPAVKSTAESVAEPAPVTELTDNNTSRPTELNILSVNLPSESTTEPAAEPTVESTIEPLAEPTITPQLTVRPVLESSTETPAAEPTPEPKNELAAETTIVPSKEPIDENTVKSETHDATHIISLPIEPEIDPTAEPTAEPSVQPTVASLNEPVTDHDDKSLENNAVNVMNLTTESAMEPTAEPTIEPTTEIPVKPLETSVNVTSELVAEHKAANISIKPETEVNFATTIETTHSPIIEELTELPKEIESPRSFEANLLENNDSKGETPLETTMEPITESNSKTQNISENHIPKTLVETTSESQPESNTETTQNVTEASQISELTTTNESISVTEQASDSKLQTTMKHENETSADTTTIPVVQPESPSGPETESPNLAVIPLEDEREAAPEQSPRQSKLSDLSSDETETTTLIDIVSNTSETLMEAPETTTAEQSQQQINSIVVSVNENKTEIKAMPTEVPQRLLISVNNATEIVNLQEPKIYEITTPASEIIKDSNEIHSHEIDQHNSNISHLNIIQESTENNGIFDNMSPFLPDIDNDTFVNKLHLGEQHFVEHHTEETPPPRLDNDEKNETNPIDLSHKINETDNVINNTETPVNSENIEITTIKIQEKWEKSTLPHEIINNVHSNQFFENLQEIKHLDELKNNSGIDSSTEDLLALETTTNHQNMTENSVETGNATIIHAEILQTATESINVISENTEKIEEPTTGKGYKVKETINDITTTERIFFPKIAQTTTEIRLPINPDEDLSVIPLGSIENDISAEEHSVLDKFSRHIDEITTTIETITENPAKCLNDQFLCTNGTGKDGSYCIPMKNRCDSIQDCSDGSDELDCKGNCHENFQCANGQCLKRHQVCDSIQHCTDGSDEINCNQWNCTTEEFSCGDNQRCLPLQWRCDGRKQCPNGIDEHNCNTTCPETSYHCKDEDICIPKTWRCDGKSDCYNSEDEQSCNCGKDQFRCSLGGGCIDYKQRCDGREDCPDRSDEWNCIRLQDRIVEIEISNNTWSPICSDNWNHTYSDVICNNLGYSGSSITENLNNGNFSNYLKLKSEQPYNVSILTQFESSDGCENVVAVTCQEFSCGSNHQTIDDQQARIVGGSRSTETQWSSLSLLYNKKLNTQCTATIITPIWVIASYSCVNNGSDWVLYAGNTNHFNNPENATTQMVAVERILQHPQVKFSQFEYTNDVVLIKLKTPLILTRNVSAVCLPENDIETRQLCVIAGWGVSQPGERNNQYLHYLPVPVIDNNECNATKHYNGLITDDKICAGFTDSTKTPCYNDEGAPLMCFSDSASIWELQGILSYHDNCGNGNHPAIYTSIKQNIKNWIINTIGRNPLKRA